MHKIETNIIAKPIYQFSIATV